MSTLENVALVLCSATLSLGCQDAAPTACPEPAPVAAAEPAPEAGFDPAVQAGRLVMELHPWYGSAAVKEINAIHARVAENNP